MPLQGFQYVKTRVDGGAGVLDAQNRPVVDFNKVVSGEDGLDVGERVRVRLSRVNVDRGFIDFVVRDAPPKSAR